MNAHRPHLTITLMLLTIAALSGCSGKTNYKAACMSELDAAWSELSIAKTQGFGGSISYTKAVSLITAAKTMQTVENFDNCYNNAKNARYYIRESQAGR